MAFVLDASVTMAWAFADELHAIARRALELLETEPGLAPSIWWYEVRNTILKGERHGRLREVNSAAFLRKLAEFQIEIDSRMDEARLLMLARRHRLSIYDAAYLELAQRNGVRLATLDLMLQRAARAEGVTLLQSSSNGT